MNRLRELDTVPLDGLIEKYVQAWETDAGWADNATAARERLCDYVWNILQFTREEEARMDAATLRRSEARRTEKGSNQVSVEEFVALRHDNQRRR